MRACSEKVKICSSGNRLSLSCSLIPSFIGFHSGNACHNLGDPINQGILFSKPIAFFGRKKYDRSAA